MALAPRLELKQGQSLVMTPQLQQAIKLLQLSNLELTAYIEEELEKNPLLERDERADAPAAEAGADAEAPRAEQAGGDESELRLSEDAPASDAEAVLDTDYETLYADASKAEIQAEGAAAGSDIDWSRSGPGGSFDGDGLDGDANLTAMLTLKDHLTEQLQVAQLSPQRRIIAAFLVDMVDEAGYLRGDLETVADRLGAELGEVAATLARLQTFDPVGVFARDLKECLRLQLKDRNRLDPAMDAFIENLELLAKHDLAGLKRACHADQDDLAEMIADVKSLNPKPGLAFGSQVIQPVVPDVFVRPAPDGGWKIELNNDTMPKVLVNTQYLAQVSGRDGAETKTYLSECMTNANWLVKSLDQRARTILKVSSEIIRQQDGFLVHGIQHLRPLNLKTVAEAISMHESTVSRVTANKYMSTPRGVFELKYFFTSAIASTNGASAHSAEAVRHRIRTLIDEESPAEVLSDDRIVEILRQSGVDIARRTVAKYREALRIPSSVQRRRQKKQSA
ncbi:MAG: RNA polymerase factor sigma-54 [Pseudomonadota bacterium]